MDHMHSDKVTAIIKTFMRPNKFERCLLHAINAGIKKIEVGYDGPDELRNDHFRIIRKARASFKDTEIKFHEYEFNYGLAAVRNALVEKVDTKYFFLLDDDEYIPANSLDLISFLELEEDIGGIAMGFTNLISTDDDNPIPTLVNDCYDLKILNGKIKAYINWNNKKILNGSGILIYYPFNHIMNCAVYRKKVWEDVKWDNRFIINGEHLDFIMKVMNNTDWKLASAANMYCVHDPGPDDGVNVDFNKYRSGEVFDYDKHELFEKKWDLDISEIDVRNNNLINTKFRSIYMKDSELLKKQYGD